MPTHEQGTYTVCQELQKCHDFVLEARNSLLTLTAEKCVAAPNLPCIDNFFLEGFEWKLTTMPHGRSLNILSTGHV